MFYQVMPKYRIHSSLFFETQAVKLLLLLWQLCSWF